ncbi:MAG: cytochrome b/b6 domain-containing protein [Phycisphaeraceae bacterium]|nr:cytochrome b/b6 domain-containing protein [Phycisphaeraceae bacterium]
MRMKNVRNNLMGSRLTQCLCVLLLVAVLPTWAQAVDAENCLMCHRFRGLSRVDKEGDSRLFYVDETLFNKGPHARVSCKGCHVDIDKIPHDNALPVNCLQSCHIEEPTREIIFTHSKVHDTLEDSVHAMTTSEGETKEHSEDYPKCKDCHDNPLFRPVSLFKTVRAGVNEQAIGRCTVCHSDDNFARYFYSHVTSRMHKARDPREVVNMCSTCHGDSELARRHDLPDVVSSYLETYHGKAVLLGSSEAPDCLDCHASHGSVHEMHSSDDARASVHEGNRSEICGTDDCHGAAAPRLASFDVHATRNMKTHKLEFAVGLFFVLMTLGLLLPILTLNIMALIRELFPSHQAEQELEELTEMARQRATQMGGIKRFTGMQRFQHVFLVVTFVVLCMTGLPMKFPETAWAPVMYSWFGGIRMAPIFHRIAGVSMLVGFAVHVLAVLLEVAFSLAKKNELSLKRWIMGVLALPMIPTAQDGKDIVVLAKYVFFLSPKPPRYGRFCWKEKLEYLGLFWGIALLGLTGIFLWAESLSSHVFPGWILNICYLAHTYESLLAVAHITLVHIPGVLGKPGVNPLSGMVWNGNISPEAMAEEHGGEILNWEPGKEVVS